MEGPTIDLSEDIKCRLRETVKELKKIARVHLELNRGHNFVQIRQFIEEIRQSKSYWRDNSPEPYQIDTGLSIEIQRQNILTNAVPLLISSGTVDAPYKSLSLLFNGDENRSVCDFHLGMLYFVAYFHKIFKKDRASGYKQFRQELIGGQVSTSLLSALSDMLNRKICVYSMNFELTLFIPQQGETVGDDIHLIRMESGNHVPLIAVNPSVEITVGDCARIPFSVTVINGIAVVGMWKPKDPKFALRQSAVNLLNGIPTLFKKLDTQIDNVIAGLRLHENQMYYSPRDSNLCQQMVIKLADLAPGFIPVDGVLQNIISRQDKEKMHSDPAYSLSIAISMCMANHTGYADAIFLALCRGIKRGNVGASASGSYDPLTNEMAKIVLASFVCHRQLNVYWISRSDEDETPFISSYSVFPGRVDTPPLHLLFSCGKFFALMPVPAIKEFSSVNSSVCGQFMISSKFATPRLIPDNGQIEEKEDNMDISQNNKRVNIELRKFLAQDIEWFTQESVRRQEIHSMSHVEREIEKRRKTAEKSRLGVHAKIFFPADTADNASTSQRAKDFAESNDSVSDFPYFLEGTTGIPDDSDKPYIPTQRVLKLSSAAEKAHLRVLVGNDDHIAILLESLKAVCCEALDKADNDHANIEYNRAIYRMQRLFNQGNKSLSMDAAIEMIRNADVVTFASQHVGNIPEEDGLLFKKKLKAFTPIQVNENGQHFWRSIAFLFTQDVHLHLVFKLLCAKVFAFSNSLYIGAAARSLFTPSTSFRFDLLKAVNNMLHLDTDDEPSSQSYPCDMTLLILSHLIKRPIVNARATEDGGLAYHVFQPTKMDKTLRVYVYSKKNMMRPLLFVRHNLKAPNVKENRVLDLFHGPMQISENVAAPAKGKKTSQSKSSEVGKDNMNENAGVEYADMWKFANANFLKDTNNSYILLNVSENDRLSAENIAQLTNQHAGPAEQIKLFHLTDNVTLVERSKDDRTKLKEANAFMNYAYPLKSDGSDTGALVKNIETNIKHGNYISHLFTTALPIQDCMPSKTQLQILLRDCIPTCKTLILPHATILPGQFGMHMSNFDIENFGSGSLIVTLIPESQHIRLRNSLRKTLGLPDSRLSAKLKDRYGPKFLHKIRDCKLLLEDGLYLTREYLENAQISAEQSIVPPFKKFIVKGMCFVQLISIEMTVVKITSMTLDDYGQLGEKTRFVPQCHCHPWNILMAELLRQNVVQHGCFGTSQDQHVTDSEDVGPYFLQDITSEDEFDNCMEESNRHNPPTHGRHGRLHAEPQAHYSGSSRFLQPAVMDVDPFVAHDEAMDTTEPENQPVSGSYASNTRVVNAPLDNVSTEDAPQGHGSSGGKEEPMEIDPDIDNERYRPGQTRSGRRTLARVGLMSNERKTPASAAVGKSNNKWYVCNKRHFEDEEICNRSYGTSYHLTEHVKSMDRSNWVTCNTCLEKVVKIRGGDSTIEFNRNGYAIGGPSHIQVKYSSASVLTRHARTHAGIQFSCPFCTSSYTQKSDLKRHLLGDAKRKPTCQNVDDQLSTEEIVQILNRLEPRAKQTNPDDPA